MLRVDAHIHGDPDAFTGDPKAYVEKCRERGIEAVVLIESLERCLKAKKKFGDFVIPVGNTIMDAFSPRDVEELIKAGCLGVKFRRPKAPYCDERYWPLYEKVEQLGAVAVFHTGFCAFRGEPEPNPTHFEYMRAAYIDAIARRFPGLKILMAHFSMPWWDEGWKVAWSQKNVYVDLSGGTAIHRSTMMWAELFAPDGKLYEPFIRKLVFGTDVRYFLKDSYPFEPYIEFHEKIFDRMNLSQEYREMVNRTTALNLFGLETR